jgi:geranylgeranyl reductase
MPGTHKMRYVNAYHEIVSAPSGERGDYDASRCDVYYQGVISPDFYGWIFPHGDSVSIGGGHGHCWLLAPSGHDEAPGGPAGLDQMTTLRREGAPIPLQPRPRWDDGHNLILAGDAAGVVAPASGEGIYYAMVSGRLAAQAADTFCTSGDVRALATARSRFMKAHGRVFPHPGTTPTFLVFERPAARKIREHVPGPGRAAAHLGGLHEQAPGQGESGRPYAHPGQGCGAPAGHSSPLTP